MGNSLKSNQINGQYKSIENVEFLLPHNQQMLMKTTVRWHSLFPNAPHPVGKDLKSSSPLVGKDAKLAYSYCQWECKLAMAFFRGIWAACNKTLKISTLSLHNFTFGNSKKVITKMRVLRMLILSVIYHREELETAQKMSNSRKLDKLQWSQCSNLTIKKHFQDYFMFVLEALEEYKEMCILSEKRRLPNHIINFV